MHRVACVVAAVALVTAVRSSTAHAQHSIDGLLTVESFDGYLGEGLEPDPATGRLDSDEWRVTGMDEGACNFAATCNAVDSDFTRGEDPDTVSIGGLYAFTVTPGNETFGFQPTTDDMRDDHLEAHQQHRRPDQRRVPRVHAVGAQRPAARDADRLRLLAR